MNIEFRSLALGALAAAFLGGMAGTASAKDIVVTQYGATAGGWPYAIALEKGFFKEEGADVTSIISSRGGGTTIRNILAAAVPFGEVGASIVLQANREGADLKIIGDAVLSVADLAWVVKPDSPLKTGKDLKGKKIGYTNPRSVTQGLSAYMAKGLGFAPTDVEFVKTGGFGEGLAALDTGLVDTTPIPEPLLSANKGKYRILVNGADVLPQMDNTVLVTTLTSEKGNEDFIKAVIRGRQRGVQFLYKNPEESAVIIAKAYQIPPDVAKSAVLNLVGIKTDGIPYFSEGRIYLGGLKREMVLQVEIGAFEGDTNFEKFLDYSYLPADQAKPAP